MSLMKNNLPEKIYKMGIISLGTSAMAFKSGAVGSSGQPALF